MTSHTQPANSQYSATQAGPSQKLIDDLPDGKNAVLTPSLSHTLSLVFFHSYTISFSHFLSLSVTHVHTLSLTFTLSFIHSFIHSLIHSFIHSFIHPLSFYVLKSPPNAAFSVMCLQLLFVLLLETSQSSSFGSRLAASVLVCESALAVAGRRKPPPPPPPKES